MLLTFNLQMFADDEFTGIDSDVLEQFKDELPEKEDATEPATADTHSDNKEDQQEQKHEEAIEDEPL